MVGNASRMLGAFFFAPILASTCVAIVTGFVFALAFVGSNPSLSDAFLRGVGFGAIAGIIAAGIATPISLVVGGLIHHLFQSRGVVGLWPYLGAGAVTGALAGGLFALVTPGDFVFLIWSTPTGALAALFAWLMRRPDLDPPRPQAAS